MSEVVVDVSELRKFDDACVKELADYLKIRLEGNIVAAKKEVTIEFEEKKEASRSFMRFILRKYLHRSGLREDFKVISGGENTFIIKEKKVYTE